jgi:hypothetical protein
MGEMAAACIGMLSGMIVKTWKYSLGRTIEQASLCFMPDGVVYFDVWYLKSWMFSILAFARL